MPVSLLMAANAISRDTCMYNGRSVLIRLVISVKLELDAAVRSLRHFAPVILLYCFTSYLLCFFSVLSCVFVLFCISFVFLCWLCNWHLCC